MNSPQLTIPRKIYQQLKFWVDKSNFEVSWLGTLLYDPKESQFIVNKIFLLDQENETAETTIKSEAICDLLYETKDEEGDLRWWGHSHVKMGVFWSGTDRKTMEELSQGGWFLSTVFNQKGEMRTAFNQGGEMPMMIDNIETHIWDPVLVSEREEWDKQYKEKVKNKTYSGYSSYHGNSPYSGYSMYTSEEYKLINLVVTGTMTKEKFLEEWAKTKKPIPQWMTEKWKDYALNFQIGRNTESGKSVSDQIIMKQIEESKKEQLNSDDSPSDEDDSEAELFEYLKLINELKGDRKNFPAKKRGKNVRN